MGNKNQAGKNGEVIVNINHPRFTNASIVSEGGQRQLQTTMGVDDREYEKWSNSLKKAKIDSPFLMLPCQQDFSRKGLCGNSGTLKVQDLKSSSTMTTTATCSLNKLRTGIVEKASLRSGSCGVCCWGSALPSKRPRERLMGRLGM